MGAPTGNQFWKIRAKHGRDKLFATPELLMEAACEYFEWCDANPFQEVEQSRGSIKAIPNEAGELIAPSGLIEIPRMRPYTIQGLCIYLDVHTTYLHEFEASLKDKEDKTSKDFSQIVKTIREIIYNQKFSGAAAGFLNANIIARDLGLSDRQELTGKDGQPLNTAPQIIIQPIQKEEAPILEKEGE